MKRSAGLLAIGLTSLFFWAPPAAQADTPLTIATASPAGVYHLAGRSVNIGNPGSGQRGTMLRLMDARGWSRSSFRLVNDLPAVRTFGVRATLVASADTDPAIIYRLVAGVFENLQRFKAYHPAFGTLTPQSMIEEGLSAPLHEGALRYYREQGWIDDGAMTAELVR